MYVYVCVYIYLYIYICIYMGVVLINILVPKFGLQQKFLTLLLYETNIARNITGAICTLVICIVYDC